MLIFCRQIIISGKEELQRMGAVILAANHPNSFLDAAIIHCLFDHSLTALARGDAFKTKFLRRLFRRLHMLPIYRNREGRENIPTNYKIFDECVNRLSNNGTILLFSEGLCVNEWHLRPLMKGTARLALQAWKAGVDVQIVPVAINYQSFRSFGKNAFISLGPAFNMSILNSEFTDGQQLHQFNEELQKHLQASVLEIPEGDLQIRRKLLSVGVNKLKKALLYLPGLIGWLIHQPLYLPLKLSVARACRNNDHYDAILFGTLMLLYPFYLLLLVGIASLYLPVTDVFALVVLIPFLAWSRVQTKKQF